MKEVSLLLGLIALTSAADDSAICKDKNKYTKDGVVTVAGTSTSCTLMIEGSGLAAVTASETTCKEKVTSPNWRKEKVKHGEQMVMRLALYSDLDVPCCGGSGTVCDAWRFNPCADASKFDGTVKLFKEKAGQDQKMTCAKFSAEAVSEGEIDNSFTASADTCDATDGGSYNRMARVVVLMAQCCTSGGTVCDAYMFNPCKVPSQFKRDSKLLADSVPASLRGFTCFQGAALQKPFTPSQSTCAAIAPDPLSGRASTFRGDLRSILATMSVIANDFGCCGDKASVCDAYSLMPCKDSLKFVTATVMESKMQSAIDAKTGGFSYPAKMTCGRFFKLSATFFADTETCKNLGPRVGISWNESMGAGGLGSSCCGGTPTVCDDPPVAITTTTTTQPVSTTSTEAVPAGATVMQVPSTAGFSVGSTVDVDLGTARHEVNIIQSFGSLIFASPLQFAHPAGTVISQALKSSQLQAQAIACGAAFVIADNHSVQCLDKASQIAIDGQHDLTMACFTCPEDFDTTLAAENLVKGCTFAPSDIWEQTQFVRGNLTAACDAATKAFAKSSGESGKKAAIGLGIGGIVCSICLCALCIGIIMTCVGGTKKRGRNDDDSSSEDIE